MYFYHVVFWFLPTDPYRYEWEGTSDLNVNHVRQLTSGGPFFSNPCPAPTGLHDFYLNPEGRELACNKQECD